MCDFYKLESTLHGKRKNSVERDNIISNGFTQLKHNYGFKLYRVYSYQICKSYGNIANGCTS